VSDSPFLINSSNVAESYSPTSFSSEIRDNLSNPCLMTLAMYISMKIKESQYQLGPAIELLPDFANIKKADWLVATAVDDIHNLEDG
jgi:hypothetical protein